MFGRNRSYVAALGGLVALLSAGAATVEPARQPESAPKAAPNAPKPDAGSDQHLSRYDRESLAVARTANRIAETANLIAEAQRSYALGQLILTIFGVGFTGVAAFFAYRATHWAKEAATAARESAAADNAALEETRKASADARKDAIEQGKRFNEQLHLADQTMQFTARTARAMGDTALETRAGAKAMRDVATAMTTNVQQIIESVAVSRRVANSQRLFGEAQLRAYVSVLIGIARYQNSLTGLWFETQPFMRNTGSTTARNLRWRVACDVLPNPLPPDFRFPIPAHKEGSSLLPAGETFLMTSVVDHMVPDDVAWAAMMGRDTGFFVWGYVIYEDIFHRTHRTTFAQQIMFDYIGERDQNWNLPPPTVRGLYLSKHNRAN